MITEVVPEVGPEVGLSPVTVGWPGLAELEAVRSTAIPPDTLAGLCRAVGWTVEDTDGS